MPKSSKKTNPEYENLSDTIAKVQSFIYRYLYYLLEHQALSSIQRCESLEQVKLK